MKQGVPDKKLIFKGGYKFLGNSFEIFEKFFGTQNPFTVALDAHGDMIGQQQTASTTSMMDAFKKRFTNLYITVKCTLEEFYYGTNKEIVFERLGMQGDAQRQLMTTAKKTLLIKPGMGPHTELVFSGEGHLRPNHKPSDLIINFQQDHHETFQRFGNDLILEHKISLLDSLTAKPVNFKTIEGEQIEVSVDEVLTPQSVKVVPGKGMPIQNDADPLAPARKDFKKGNLIVKFDIQFPDNLNQEKKEALFQVLEAVDEEYAAQFAY